MTDRYPLLHGYPAGDMLRTPLLAEQRFDVLPDRFADARLSIVVTPPQRQLVGLLGPIATSDPDCGAIPG